MADRARSDVNNTDSLLAVSTGDGATPVTLYADPATHALLISGSLTIGGSAIPAAGATTAVVVQIVDGSGNQITSFGGGTQYTNGAAQATPTGTVALGWDGANVRALSTDSSGRQILGPSSQIIGKAGIDQTTPGTTNAISLAQIGAVTVSAGNGVAGTGVQRVAIASDNTAFGVNSFTSSPNAAALGIFGYINPYGSVRVTNDPTTLFFDAFDGKIDSVKWAVGGNPLPMASNSSVTVYPAFGINVTNNSTLISVPKFVHNGLGLLTTAMTVQLESAAATTNVHRFWGRGIVNTYAFGTPVTDGVGFEVTAAGDLQCVMFIAGTKYVINSTTGGNISAAPTGATFSNFGTNLSFQGNTHRYAIIERADAVWWYVEGLEKPVAVATYTTPITQTLPIRIAAITDPASTSTTGTFAVGGITISDTSSQNVYSSDSLYPWQQQRINAAGAASVSIGDGASSGRNAAVNGSNQLSVSLDGISSGFSVMVAPTPNTPLPVYLVGPSGDPMDQIVRSLPVAISQPVPVSDETSTIFNGPAPLVPQFGQISISTSGSNTLITGTPGRRIRVLAYTLMANGAVNGKWQTIGNATNDLSGLLYMATNTGASPAYIPVGHFQTGLGESLGFNLSGSVAVGGHFTYVVV